MLWKGYPLYPLSRCDYEYAKKVLSAMKDGRLEDIKKRAKKRTAISEGVWPDRVREALQLQRNTRMVPGNRTVSMAYGVRRPLIHMRRSKIAMLKELREQYEHEGPPSVSTLLTLIPANYKHPGEKDRECNCCVQHCNLWHCGKALRPLVPSLPVSSRQSEIPHNLFTE